MADVFDLLVIGGGPAGSATALAAHAQGMRVALAEAGRPPMRKVCGEFLSDTGMTAWRRMTGRSPGDAPRLMTAAFRLADAPRRVATFPLDPPAWGLKRETLDGALLETCAARGVRTWFEARAGRPGPHAGGWRVPLRRAAGAEGPDSVDARRVVMAVGRRPVAEEGAGWFGMKGATSAGAAGADIEIVLLPDGSYYGLCAVNDGEASLCALSREDRAPWLADPARAADSVTPFRGTPRFRTGRQEPVAEGLFAVGDALAAWPPLVGDGITSALLGGVLLGNSLGIDGELTPMAWVRRWEAHFSGALRRSLALHATLRRPALRGGLLTLAAARPGLAARLARATRLTACECALCRVPEVPVDGEAAASTAARGAPDATNA